MANKAAPYPNELRTCIKLAGFSVRGVSKETKIPESTLHDWAAGNRVIPHNERMAIAELLGCSIECLAPHLSISVLPSPTQEAPLTQEALSDEQAPPFSLAVAQDTIEVSVSEPEVENGGSGLAAQDSDSMQQPTPAWTHQEHVDFSLSPEQMELLLTFGRGDYTMLSDPSKRDALQRIAALVLAASGSSVTGSFTMSDPEPWERLFLAQQVSSSSTILNATTLEYFKQLLTTSWQLCDENQLDTAEGVLAGFLPQLLLLPRQEPDTAFLVSHGLRLHSVLAHHHLRLSDKVRLCEQSVSYAREARNANTLATALLELVWAYKYAKQPEKCLEPLQELLDLSLQVSPLVQFSYLLSLFCRSCRERTYARSRILYRTCTRKSSQTIRRKIQDLLSLIVVCSSSLTVRVSSASTLAQLRRLLMHLSTTNSIHLVYLPPSLSDTGLKLQMDKVGQQSLTMMQKGMQVF